jgi:urease accessory protein
VWLVPLTFVSVMALGGLLGASGISVPFVEQGIASSVLILGLLIAASVRLPLVASALLVGAFAIFHGYAHGAEMPVTASGFGYGLGFVTATALLHVAGIAIGLMAKNWSGERFVRLAGGAIAACGLALCFA